MRPLRHASLPPAALAAALLLAGCPSTHEGSEQDSGLRGDAGRDAQVESLDSATPPDAQLGIDATSPRDAAIAEDASRARSSCASPERLDAGVRRRAFADAPGLCIEPGGGDVSFFAVTIPVFSQMVPLEGAALPQIIGDCECALPYFESTAGYGEPLELIAVGEAGAQVGYAIERLEDNAACAAAVEVPVGGSTAPRRLDRAGARLALCGGAALRPLYFVVADAAASMLFVEVSPPTPYAVGVFDADCENRFECSASAHSADGRALAGIALPAGARRYVMVALDGAEREVSVTVRAD